MTRTITTVLAALTLFSIGVSAKQASLAIQSAQMAYCYKQDANWSLTKTNTSGYPNSVTSGTSVSWTIAATRGDNGPKQVCVIGYISVKNTGNSPATIGNIVVDLQRQSKPDGSGKKSPTWTEIAADVANAYLGDAATSANILGQALANDTAYPDVTGDPKKAAKFTENAVSGSLSFTDADLNTWAISPQKTIQPEATVNLFFTAIFNAGNITPALTANEQLRTEVFVSYGDAGRDGIGDPGAPWIDISGDGTLQTDEAYASTVSVQIAKALPALEICNDTVTITDTFSATGTAAVTFTQNPIGSGVTTNTTNTYVVTGKVSGAGLLSNTAELKGAGSDVTLTIGTGEVTRECCIAVDLTANSYVLVDGAAPVSQGYCSYTKGGYAGGGGKANGVPAQLFDNNFPGVFSNGLTIGVAGTASHAATWTNTAPGPANLKTYLTSPAKGDSGALTANTENATSTAGGQLPRQTAALTLNIEFGNAHLFTGSNLGIGGLKLTGTGTSLDGKTVAEILVIANQALGTGALPAGYTFGDLNTLIDNLNQSWDDCNQSVWSAAHLQ